MKIDRRPGAPSMALFMAVLVPSVALSAGRDPADGCRKRYAAFEEDWNRLHPAWEAARRAVENQVPEGFARSAEESTTRREGLVLDHLGADAVADNRHCASNPDQARQYIEHDIRQLDNLVGPVLRDALRKNRI